MAPRDSSASFPSVRENEKEEFSKYKTSKGPFMTDIYWPNTIGLAFIMPGAIYTIFTFPWIQSYKTALFGFVYLYLSTFGLTMAAHRYFSHKTFKAKTPLKVIMVWLYAMGGLYPMYNWVLDHRMHHKFSDKMGDPHNIKRGFFFAHVGWLMLKRDSVYLNKDNFVDMSDYKNDPVVKVFEKYYFFILFFSIYLIPVGVPMYFWNETFVNAFKMTVLRYALINNLAWSINSFAHTFGKQPYNKNLVAKENLTASLFTNGEGYHNYHHAFPWDYKASELGKFNATTSLIRFFAKLGWAYDLKEVEPDYIRRITLKYGDQSHEHCKNQEYQNGTISEETDIKSSILKQTVK